MAAPNNTHYKLVTDNAECAAHIAECKFCREFLIRFRPAGADLNECDSCGAANFAAGCPNYNCQCSYTSWYPKSREAWYMRIEFNLSGSHCSFVTDYDDIAEEYQNSMDEAKQYASEKNLTLEQAIENIITAYVNDSHARPKVDYGDKKEDLDKVD